MRVTTHLTEPAGHEQTDPTRQAPRLALLVVLTVVLTIAAILVVAGLVIVGASAAHAEPPPAAPNVPSSIDVVLTNIRNWIMGILAALATVFLTIGGVRYVLAGGDPGEVERAKSAFKSAGWGYGLAALAPLVVSILKQLVGVQ